MGRRAIVEDTIGRVGKPAGAARSDCQTILALSVTSPLSADALIACVRSPVYVRLCTLKRRVQQTVRIDVSMSLSVLVRMQCIALSGCFHVLSTLRQPSSSNSTEMSLQSDTAQSLTRG